MYFVPFPFARVSTFIYNQFVMDQIPAKLQGTKLLSNPNTSHCVFVDNDMLTDNLADHL